MFLPLSPPCFFALTRPLLRKLLIIFNLQECLDDADCVAINFTPPQVLEDEGISLTSTCYKAIGQCTADDSEHETIYYKPTLSDLGQSCYCPSEYYDGRMIYHTIYSQQLAAGTRHVAATNLSSGISIVSGIYSVFHNGASFNLTLKLLDIPITAAAPALVLANNPTAFSFDPIEPSQGICSCAARAGLLMSDYSGLRGPSCPGAYVQDKALNLLSLIEIKALSCLCTFQQLNLSLCLGCCRTLCWYGSQNI